MDWENSQLGVWGALMVGKNWSAGGGGQRQSAGAKHES